jgi:hypothetical protein
MEAQLKEEGSSGPCRRSSAGTPAGMLARFARLTRPGDEGLGLGMRIGAALPGDGMVGWLVGSVYIGRRIGWEGGEKGDGMTMLLLRITGDVAAVNIRALDPDGFSDERHS